MFQSLIHNLRRFRFDRRRHWAAVAAIAVLSASFVVFVAVASSVDAGVQHFLETERPHHLPYHASPREGDGNLTSADVEMMRAWEGVDHVSPIAVVDSGLENTIQGPFRPAGGSGIPLAGVDPDLEREIVEAEPNAAQPEDEQPGLVRIEIGGNAYRLLQGRWLDAPTEAVVTQNLATRFPLGSTLTVNTSLGSRGYTVVGVVANGNPAQVPLPGLIPVSVIIVDVDSLPFQSYQAVRIVTETDHESISSVARELEAFDPFSSFLIRERVSSFEAKHFDALQANQVLSAATRLLAVAGAFVLFGVSHLLLGAERKTLGVLAAVGFARRRVLQYATSKITLLLLLGLGLGVPAGMLAYQLLPLPELGFEMPRVAALGPVVAAITWAVAATIVGALVAVALRVRESPVDQLRILD